MIVNPDKFQAIVAKRNSSINTAWKVSKYGVFSGPYLPVFSLNTGKYGPEKTPYLGTFHAVEWPTHSWYWR